MSTVENVKVAQALFDALNAHDLDAYDRMEADDVKLQGPGTPGVLNKTQARTYLQGFITAFPDLHFDITRTVAEGDYVVFEWSGQGTHTGPLVTPSGASIPPTGKKGNVMGSSTNEVKQGKITASWIYWDMVSLLGQLGLMPPM